MEAPTGHPEGPGPLHAVARGDAGPRVVLAHGFTQTQVAWTALAADLAVDHRVLAVDLPGHGGSAHVAGADLARSAALLGESGGPAVYVGYSMGGRVAMRLALDRPDLARGLVLIGATAGIDDPDQRAARRIADEALATRIEDEGVEAFVAGWLGQPLFAGLEVSPDDLAARLANRPEGLAQSLRHAGTGTMDPPWWDELPALQVPTLVVAGALDTKFAALGQRLVDGIRLGGGPAVLHLVDDVGHAAHLEAPTEVSRIVRDHIASLEP